MTQPAPPCIRRDLRSLFHPGLISRRLAAWTALFTMLLAVWPAAAQLDTGSISGTITDPSGSVVVSAKVTAEELATGTTYTTTSSKTGYYVFPSVHTGNYRLTIASTGFKTTISTGITVSIGGATAHDLTLQVGATTETVAITSSALALETETSDVATSIQSQQVEDLPLQVTGALRSLSTLTFLVPGAVGPGTSAGGAGGQIIAKINGGQTLGSEYLVDGITTNRAENGSGGFDGISPSVEAIQEFRVSISALPADIGRTTGGIANFNSRSGTNAYHGTVYDFFKNAALDGNNWFNNGYLAEATSPAAAAALQRPPDTKNDYGITLGGPVRIPHVYDGKDKTFFFFGWEQLRYSTGSAITSTLPTPAVRGDNQQYADFSSFLGGQIPGVTNPCTGGGPLYYGQIFDPQTVQNQYTSNECRSPFPNNQIPYDRFSAVALNVLKLLPEPNLSGASNNFVYDTAAALTQTVYSIRIDENLGPRQKIWGFWSSRENSAQGNDFNLPSPLNNCCPVSDDYGKLLRIGWEWIFTPRLINELTFGSNRSNNFTYAEAVGQNANWGAAIGLPNAAGPTFPGFVFVNSAYPSFGENSDAQDVDNGIILNDSVNWVHGAHSFKFGGTAAYHQYSFVSAIGGTCSGVSGCFTFYPGQTAGLLTEQGNTGNSFADFLIGQSGDVNRVVDLHAPRWISHYAAVFAQDDWKVRPNLTLNLGLRWSFETPRHESEGDTTSFEPNVPNTAANGILGALVFGGVGPGRDGNKGETWANTYYKDFEPRVGFAWNPDQFNRRLVVRGNYGIYYGPLVDADYGQGTTAGFTITPNVFNAGDPMSGPLVDAGLPLLPTTPDLDPTQLNGQGVDYVAKSYGKPAMVQTWTLENQFQLTPNLIFTLGYLGQHSIRLHGLIDYPNDMPLSGLALGNTLFDLAPNGGVPLPYANFQTTWGGGGTVSQALRPFPQYGYINTDSYLQNVGQSSYDALEAKLERRFHNGLNVLVSYTFSKTLTDADSIQPYYSTLQSQGGTQNPYDHKAEKAVSNQDIPNNFVVSYLYELPVGRGKRVLGNAPRAVNAVVSNWRISGVQRYLSGQPISFFGEPGIPGFDNGIRPNRVPGQPVKGFTGSYDPFSWSVTNTCGTGYWNCTAFADPNANRGTGAFQFGDMPRNSGDIRSFPFYQEDFSINKTIPIRETVKLEFRGEMFNAFNRHIFNKPDSGVLDSNFGQISSTLNGPRNVQFVLKITY
jgi:Carboxypeptidase regulatory-like domain